MNPFVATRENVQSDEEDIETDYIDSNLPDDDGIKQDNDDGGGVPDVSVLDYIGFGSVGIKIHICCVALLRNTTGLSAVYLCCIS